MKSLEFSRLPVSINARISHQTRGILGFTFSLKCKRNFYQTNDIFIGIPLLYFRNGPVAELLTG